MRRKSIFLDYIDVVAVKEDTLALVIGDVSSHGVAPGLVMSMTRSFLRSQLQKYLPLKEIALSLNELLLEDTPSDMFITLFLAYWNIEKDVFHYLSCGHNPPFLLEHKKGVKKFPRGGMAVGIMMQEIFASTLKEGTIPFRKGSYIFLYTDGLTEAENPQKEMFSEDRVAKILEKESLRENLNSKIILRDMLRNLEHFTQLSLPEEGPTPLKDDVALLAAGYR